MLVLDITAHGNGRAIAAGYHFGYARGGQDTPAKVLKDRLPGFQFDTCVKALDWNIYRFSGSTAYAVFRVEERQTVAYSSPCIAVFAEKGFSREGRARHQTPRCTSTQQYRLWVQICHRQNQINASPTNHTNMLFK